MTIGANQPYLVYAALKDDATNVEKIRRSVTAILESERQKRRPQQQRERLPRKTQGLEP